MRKLLEFVTIMVFCVSIASGSTIMLISDSGFWRPGAGTYEFLDADGEEEFQDSTLVVFLEDLGYTVDKSGMAGAYREGENWTADPDKVDALNAADLIIVSRKTSSSSYDTDRKAWNELAVPLLCQCASMVRNDKWNWCNEGIAQQTGGALNMNIVMGHPLVDGFSDPVAVFVDEAIPAPPQNPDSDTVWDAHTSIIGTYEGAFMLVDIPAGTDFDALAETTDVYGVSGARRVYFGIYTYDAAETHWGAGLTDDYKALFAQIVDKTMNSTVKIVNDLPAHGAVDIPLDLADPDNDLVFTILDPNVIEVDVYLGTEGDPNLISKPDCQIMVEHIAPVTAGQYTVDLEGEIDELLGGKDYYWKVIGYEPNAVTSIPEPATAGPTWQFQTQPDFPVISGVSPEKIAAKAGDPNVIFTVEHENVDTFQWYKVGLGALPLGDDRWDGVNTDTLVINWIDEEDIGFYYCKGNDEVTSEPYGELSFKELKHHFEFNSADVVGTITPDSVGGVQAQLMGGASVVTGPNSLIGDYLYLDNSGDTGDLQYVNIMDDVTDYPNVTISAWFRQDTHDIGPIFDFGQSSPDLWYFTFTPGYHGDTAKVEYQHETQQEYEFVFDRTDDWQFIVITVSSDGESKMYIDGQYRASDDLEANLTDITKSKNYIGFRIYTNLPKFDGLIDELKIYNYILSDVEIAQEYINVMGGFVCSEDYDLQAYDYDHNCRVDLIDIAEFITMWLEHDRIYRP